MISWKYLLILSLFSVSTLSKEEKENDHLLVLMKAWKDVQFMENSKETITTFETTSSGLLKEKNRKQNKRNRANRMKPKAGLDEEPSFMSKFPIFALKIHDLPKYQEDYQDFMTNAQQNCLTQLKETVTVYFLTVHQTELGIVLQEDFLKDLMPKIGHKLHYDRDSFSLSQGYLELSEDSLEIGQVLISMTIQKDQTFHLTFVIPSITSSLIRDCEMSKEYQAKYLKVSTGLVSIQWLLALQAVQNDRVLSRTGATQVSMKTTTTGLLLHKLMPLTNRPS
jgi:hypothetical protein